jgi:hypothetical protein
MNYKLHNINTSSNFKLVACSKPFQSVWSCRDSNRRSVARSSNVLSTEPTRLYQRKKMLHYITLQVTSSINLVHMYPFLMHYLTSRLNLPSLFPVVDFVILLNIFFSLLDMRILFTIYYQMLKSVLSV